MRSMLIIITLTLSLALAAGCGGSDGDTAGDTGIGTGGSATTAGSGASTSVPHTVTVVSFVSPFETEEINAPPRENEILAMVKVRIVNDGDGDYSLRPNRFTLETVSGEQYLPDVLYQGDDRLRDMTLAPGEEVEGVWVFFIDAAETPTGIKEGIQGELIPLPPLSS